MKNSHRQSAPVKQRLLTLSGEVDIAANTGRDLASTDDAGADVVVDMSAVTFLDCSGYRNIVSARLAHEARGGSLALFAATGQPESFLRMIEDLGRKSA